MTKPTLFVALQGPLLIPSSHPNEYLGAGVAPFAKTFLAWAQDRFHVQVLTDENLRQVHYLTNHLELPSDKVTPRGFAVSKTEVIEPNQDFYWVDSELIPGEVAWLAKHGHYDRFLAVDPTVGVTPQHKEVLEALTRSARKIHF